MNVILNHETRRDVDCFMQLPKAIKNYTLKSFSQKFMIDIVVKSKIIYMDVAQQL